MIPHPNSGFQFRRVDPSPPIPSEVVVEISTTVHITDYRKYYNEPIQSFHLTYYALPDGSLVCPPFIKDLNQVQVFLPLTAAICAFFCMNILTVIGFIRRGKVKNKGLLYVLLVSQVAGVISLIPYFIGMFDQSANCYILLLITHLVFTVSMSLLITGIFGAKAYRCLNNSGVVLLGLCALRGLSLIFTAVDISKLTAARRLSGSCVRSSAPTFLVAGFMSQLLEMFFISSCFFYALWKLHKVPSRKGRLCISVTADSGVRPLRCTNERGARKGWWDYVSEDPLTPEVKSEVEAVPSNPSYIARIRLALARFWHTDDPDPLPQRKPSLHADHPIPQPTRPSSLPHASQLTTPDDDSVRPSIRSCRAARLSKLLPQIKVFAEVLRNELVFTAMVTLMQLIVSVISVIGMYNETIVRAYWWMMGNWVLLSALTLHSFHRVVCRHDREFYQQQQATRHTSHRAERDTYEESLDNFRRTRSSLSYRISSRNISTANLPPSHDPLNDFNLAPVRAYYYRQSDSSSSPHSVRTIDSCSAISWKPSSVRIEHPFLDVPSKFKFPPPPLNIENITPGIRSVCNGSDVSSHGQRGGEEGEPPDCEPP